VSPSVGQIDLSFVQPKKFAEAAVRLQRVLDIITLPLVLDWVDELPKFSDFLLGIYLTRAVTGVLSVYVYERCTGHEHDDEKEASIRNGTLLIKSSRRDHFVDTSFDLFIYVLAVLDKV
jgi:hypothetical protein